MLLIQKCWLLNHLAKNKIGTFWRSVKFRNSMQETLKFFVGILGEMMTSYIHSEFNWPLACCWKLCKHRTGSYFSLLFFFSVTLYLNTKQSYLNFWFSVTKFLQKPFLPHTHTWALLADWLADSLKWASRAKFRTPQWQHVALREFGNDLCTKLEIKEMNPNKLHRGALGHRRTAEPAGTTIPRWPPHSILQNLGKTSELKGLPRMASLTHTYPRDPLIGIFWYIHQSLATPPHNLIWKI